jgi:Ca-activated chloride channel homolog
MRLTALAFLTAQVVLGQRLDPATIRVDVDLVNILCSVREKDGTWARGLEKKDFEVREEGRVQPITHFAADTDSPLTIAVLLDVSSSVKSVLGEEKQAAKRFFEDVLRPRDQALLATFSSTIPIWQELTGSVAGLKEAVDLAGSEPPQGAAADIRPRGGTLMYDAIDLVASRKLKAISGRKAIVLITDGMDGGSLATPKAAVRSALEADAMIFAIHYTASRFVNPIYGSGALAALCAPTGGRVFQVAGTLTVQKIFQQITDLLRHQYSVGFPPSSGVRDSRFRKVEVKVLRPGLKIDARNGYYAMQ